MRKRPMLSTKRNLSGLFSFLVLAGALAPSQIPGFVKQFQPIGQKDIRSAVKRVKKAERPKRDPSAAILWREPTDIKTRNLFYGPGGKDHMPKGNLVFIQEKMNGVNPKFDVRDEDGVRWGVKFGIEAKPETAATRLVWAV